MSLLKRIIKMAAKPAINKHKGKVGERKVDQVLNPIFWGKFDHHQINDLILMDEQGKSHQIDHIVIANNGIFCIETKNFIGYILGSENQDKWVQCLFNGEKHSFLNPLKQNKSHIYHLNKVLKNQYKINSLVVMVQNNADKIQCPNVVNLVDLKKYITSFNDGTFISDEEMDQIYDTIVLSASKIKNKEHVKNIHQTKNEIKKGICPRCGGNLVKRNGKYGEFFGCSNFPNCKFILK
ncbi:MAG: NERD domain-containing protein [Anaeroplasmataceae bacterium]|nr:NERD domain-containing protein [Anaeroplasmataceae bacterium]